MLTAAGEMAVQSGDYVEALAILEPIPAQNTAAGRVREAIRITNQIGVALARTGRGDEVPQLIRAALRQLEREGVAADSLDPDIAELNATLARAVVFSSDPSASFEPSEIALRSAQALAMPGPLSDALITRASVCLYLGRPEEARLLYAGAIEIAQRHGLQEQLHRALSNAGNQAMLWDAPEARRLSEAALAEARRHGNRYSESIAAANLMYLGQLSGEWAQSERLGRALLDDDEQRPAAGHICVILAALAVLRGDVDAASAYSGRTDSWVSSDDPEFRLLHIAVTAALRLAEGSPIEAFTLGSPAIVEAAQLMGLFHDSVRLGWPVTLQAALDSGRLDEARSVVRLLADSPPGLIPPYLQAQLARGRALLRQAEGDDEAVEGDLRDGIARFTTLQYPYWLAVTQTDLASWLLDQDRRDEAQPLLDAAIATFTELRAQPALTRAQNLTRALATVLASGPAPVPQS